MMPSTLNFRALVPILDVMNAIAHASAAPVSGPKLDNRRVAAAIVDLLIVSVGAMAILVAGDSLSGDRQGALGAVILGWALYYFFALESGEGQTVGKKLMKIRVVRADGRPAGMREVAVRTVLRVIDNYLVGLIVMLATGDRRQRIGDLAAGTIVVDASGPALGSPAPAAVAEPEDAVDADEADEADELVEDVEDVGDVEDVEDVEDVDPVVEDEPVATKTITLPARPAPPATLADLTEPEAETAPVEDEVAADEPVAEVAVEEPVAEVEVEPEPVVEVEPEPVVEVEPEPVVEAEPVPVARTAEEPVEDEADELPPVTSPTLEELAQDVAAARVEPEVEDAPEDDEPVNVKSVETVSAIDLVMGGAEEQSSESTSESAQDAEDPASA
jgi:uncharacterized RDD family membrane protein YckC